MTYRADYIVIGAGVAAASVAFELASTERVVLLGQPRPPNDLRSERRVAIASETQASPVLRALTVASAPFFDNPPEEFEQGYLERGYVASPRPFLVVARGEQQPEVERLHRGAYPALTLLDAANSERRAPMRRAGYAAGGLLDEDAGELDVLAIHSGFLCGAELNGGLIAPPTEIVAVTRVRDSWRVSTTVGEFAAGIVVDAAETRADQVAMLFGAAPIGVAARPCRVFAFATRSTERCADGQAVTDMLGSLGFSPGLIGAPCSVADRVGDPVNFDRQGISLAWGCAQDLVADGTPVVGFDDDVEGFFWFAALGEPGVQILPATSRGAGALLRGLPLPGDLAALGIEEAALSPRRLREPHVRADRPPVEKEYGRA